MAIGEPVEPAEPTEPVATSEPVTPEPSAIDFSSEDTYQQFVQTLPEAQRDLPFFKETKNFASLADQTINQQKMLGKPKLPVPQDDWGDNEWNDFYSKIRPETSSDYEIPDKFDIKLTEDGETKEFSLTEEASDTLKQLSHDMGLSKRQAGQLAKAYAEQGLGATENLNAQIAEDVKGKISALQAEWGSEYEVKHRAANEAFDTLSAEIPELKELIEWSPIVAHHPAVMKLFERLSPLVGDLGMQSGNSGFDGGFGGETVAGIKGQIADLDTTHNAIIMSDPSEMSMADRTKREQILAQRAALYKKLYAE